MEVAKGLGVAEEGIGYLGAVEESGDGLGSDRGTRRMNSTVARQQFQNSAAGGLECL